MKYMLDTNICIFIINKRSPRVLQKIAAQDVGDICISSVTVAELFYGVYKSERIEQNHQALTQFLLPLVVLEFDALASEAYGKIRMKLEKKGTPIGSMDMLIAAHASSAKMTLVTSNTKEFARVPDLVVEDWTKE
jgi:tRNA(fMet)-specific endonuclease VapC